MQIHKIMLCNKYQVITFVFKPMQLCMGHKTTVLKANKTNDLLMIKIYTYC